MKIIVFRWVCKHFSTPLSEMHALSSLMHGGYVYNRDYIFFIAPTTRTLQAPLGRRPFVEKKHVKQNFPVDTITDLIMDFVKKPGILKNTNEHV